MRFAAIAARFAATLVGGGVAANFHNPSGKKIRFSGRGGASGKPFLGYRFLQEEKVRFCFSFFNFASNTKNPILVKFQKKPKLSKIEICRYTYRECHYLSGR